MGWLGNVFILIGMYLIGRMYLSGFIICAIGETIWACYAFFGRHETDLGVICIVFIVMNLWNATKWYID